MSARDFRVAKHYKMIEKRRDHLIQDDDDIQSITLQGAKSVASKRALYPSTTIELYQLAGDEWRLISTRVKGKWSHQ